MMAERANILMIICHDIGRHLGCYGERVDTPNLDRLAREGVVFENYFCTAPQCSPSRGSIMTGKYPHRNGLIGLTHLGWKLNEEEKILPQVLTEAGYETFLFGVQHEAEDASRLGYDNMFPGHDARKTYADIETELFSRREHERPFFASAGLFEPHRLADGSFGNEKYSAPPPSQVEAPPYLPDRPGIRRDIAGLNGMVKYADEFAGKCLKGLEEAGLADDTLVIFTTDHGIAMPRAKGTLYDPGIGTALIMHKPGEFCGGKAYGELLSNVDLLPTLAEYAGARESSGIDGKSFLSLLKGGEYAGREAVFAEITYHCQYNPQRCVRTERHKYIRSFSDAVSVYLPADIYRSPAGREVRDEYYATKRPGEELYDLKADPLEMNNIACEPSSQEVRKILSKKLSSWMEETGDFLPESAPPPPENQKKRSTEPNNPEWRNNL